MHLIKAMPYEMPYEMPFTQCHHNRFTACRQAMNKPPINITNIAIDAMNMMEFPLFTDAGSKTNLIVCFPAGTDNPRKT